MTKGLRYAWSRLGITVKLWLVFALLFCFTAMAGIAGYVGLNVVREAEADILANMELRHKILEMEGQLEKSRRLYRDFRLHAQEMDFDRAQERYYQPALAGAARVIAISEDLKHSIAASRPGGPIAKRNVDINLFSSIAHRYSQTLLEETELIATIGDAQSGLLGRLGSIVARLGDLLAASPEAALALRKLDLLGKQYQITRKRPFMQSAFNEIAVLRRSLDNDRRLGPDAVTEAKRELDAYVAVADKLLDANVSLNATANDFVLQARAVDPISEDLKRLSAEVVGKARERIQLASRVAGSIILVSALLGLACVIIVGRVLHASITSKIVAMTRQASAIRAGHLDVEVPSGSGDEIGVLAGTLGSMTTRLRDMVENLEEKVRVRTLELAEKNKELDAKNQALEVLSLTDRLTGLCNRRKIDQALGAEWRRAVRYRTAFSVIMVDLDHFKFVNDTYGHAVGDEVLVRTADILVSCSRETDVVGRWGGEEFLIICPETCLDEARHLAEHVRQAFAAMNFPGIGSMTASFGLADYEPGFDAATMVERADMALYRAKQLGRDRVEAASGVTVATVTTLGRV